MTTTISTIAHILCPFQVESCSLSKWFRSFSSEIPFLLLRKLIYVA